MSFISKILNKDQTPSKLETYFAPFREQIVGNDTYFISPYGKQKIIYADWTASGRLYRPIEEKLLNDIGPFVANTHTETSITGSTMTRAYHEARHLIKNHVNASEDDVLITVGTGMTGAINKFQRILGLKLSENLKDHTTIPEEKRPIIFVSHMEHHSNQTSWLETIARVEVIPSNKDGLPCLKGLKELLKKYKDTPLKIAAVTGCSNVTGIRTNYYEISKIMHKNNGLCFVDFACSAPYVNIDMHPKDDEQYLDAITFSPHKFLGGPGTSGVLVFNKKLYKNLVPDNPGGGTVNYTNPWGNHDYIDDIETREDGGTPGFLQVIKIALSIQLKEEMGVQNILDREHELNALIFKRLSKINHLNILAPKHTERLGVFSFFIENVHYNLIVKLLNDRFGIQTRGGCSCAGTYGHYLLNVDEPTSKSIEKKILEGCLIERPGWVRMSIHPTMTNEEVTFICDAIEAVTKNNEDWEKDYQYNAAKNEFINKNNLDVEKTITEKWFE
ncbi:aminotransferase class V-fold PLP-dependent enzyme [Tamlana sp. 2_MG-2023]|uniref:aminotransferase class V-fold PLP-dependent enzyme n=1 Tax=unclassified Tamlana TaxID=2614803 RepID=UPI0026E3BE39|nr:MULTISPECIES: aminotransferase class V-fold PLP-dependent enzyme [unclassified Tamlana]MDO6760261.1 aminotransferase class V-fold PLP-dependent enzyme [Tamlana sp. 2_MG-2023]MDO6790041.1 aminotransferase class V-fold PLP-dependent enzyme [Tamlana sp. 1_MG-2023]